jgi:ABC-type transport system involved in multi-copper enzyme maturation permease subunit
MNRVLLATRLEAYTGLRSFSSKLLIVTPSLVAALQLLLVKITETGQASRDSLLGRSNVSDEFAANAYGYFVDGLSTGLTILALLLVSLAAYSFSYDRDIGIARHLIIRGISRTAVIAGKLIYIHLLALVSIITLLLSCYLLSGSLWDFGPIVEDGFELISETEIWTEVELGLSLALLPLPAAIGFGMLVSVLSQSATQALSTAIGFTLAIDVFKSTLGDLAYYHYANFQPSLLDQSYLKDVSRLVRGYSDVLVDERFLDFNLWVPLPSLVIFVLLTLVTVQRIKL